MWENNIHGYKLANRLRYHDDDGVGDRGSATKATDLHWLHSDR